VNCNFITDPQILILASLADGEKHGYAMMEDIHQFGGVRLGAGTLYGAITRLEEQSWIERVDSADRRKPYRITGLGIAHLEKQTEAMNRVVKTRHTQAETRMRRWIILAGRLYPRDWRDRYGEEFTAVLEDARPTGASCST